MTPKPRRRWFQFSLLTMFVVVTLVCVACEWAVYSLNWIRQRHDFRVGKFGFAKSKLTYECTAPSLLCVFGETGDTPIYVHHEYCDEARRLFPEARVEGYEKGSHVLHRNYRFQYLPELVEPLQKGEPNDVGISFLVVELPDGRERYCLTTAISRNPFSQPGLEDNLNVKLYATLTDFAMAIRQLPGREVTPAILRHWLPTRYRLRALTSEELERARALIEEMAH